jgi:hypothetical protein
LCFRERVGPPLVRPRIAQALTHLTKRASEETYGICRTGGYRAALTGSDFGQGHAIMQMSVAGRSSEVHTTPPAKGRRTSLLEEFELWSDYDAYARPSAAPLLPCSDRRDHGAV